METALLILTNAIWSTQQVSQAAIVTVYSAADQKVIAGSVLGRNCILRKMGAATRFAELPWEWYISF
jgi:hypothetical protein